jgi:hypothetical protein
LKYKREHPRTALLAEVIGRLRGWRKNLEFARDWKVETERGQLLRLRDMERAVNEIRRHEAMLQAFDPDEIEAMEESIQFGLELASR